VRQAAGVLEVGLVGAGPWASMVHGPVLAAGPETRLAGVWARRPDAAAELAGRLGVPFFDRYDALLDACDAVAFAVPPGVQAVMAAQAAAAGKALLLEKPIGADLADAERLADAVGTAGVPSLVVLTFRYAPAVRAFIEQARAIEPTGGRAWFISGAFLSGPFMTPWRLEQGALLDLGPHVLDLLDAAIGPIVDVHAHGHRHGWVGIQCEHESGASSDAAMCASVAVDPQRAGAEAYSPTGSAEVDAAASVGVDAFANVRATFARITATGEVRHELDVHHGLHLQRLIAKAFDDLADS
jgi:predicted dehydrogenase